MMSNKFYYFEEKDLVDILDKVYEEGWSGSLELKESFISDILKEHCKESEVSIKSRGIDGTDSDAAATTRIYETTSITTKDFENPQMLLNFNSSDYRKEDIVVDVKDINQFTWPTDTVLWTETETETKAKTEFSSWPEFHSDGINNLNNQWRIK